MTKIDTSKVTVGVPVLMKPGNNVANVTAYAVALDILPVSAGTSKVTAYVVALDLLKPGDVFQFNPNDAPKLDLHTASGQTYVSEDGGKSLFIRIPAADTYTQIIELHDGEWFINFVNFVAGDNLLPSLSFRRMLHVRGRLSTDTIRRTISLLQTQ